jgi:DNA-binding PadR family transcriptional regulator
VGWNLDDLDKYIERPLIRGLLRLLILGALSKGESYGYQVYRRVKEVTKSKVSLSTFYTILWELERRGLIARSSDRYMLTERGILALTVLLTKYHYLEAVIKHI